MIDTELEAVDRRHAQLTRLSTELVDALNLYHQLMHENIPPYGLPGGHQPQSHIPASTAGKWDRCTYEILQPTHYLMRFEPIKIF